MALVFVAVAGIRVEFVYSISLSKYNCEWFVVNGFALLLWCGDSE